eukprot:575283-Pleurochrysis_carterae.AAC.2
MMREVREDSLSGSKQFVGRAAHRSAQHSDSIRNVEARLRRARAVDGTIGLGQECMFDKLGQRLRRGRARFVERERDTVRKFHMIGDSVDVNVQEIGHEPFVLYIPPLSEGMGEVVVQRVRSVMRVKREELVDVTANNEALLDPSYGLREGEDAGVRFALSESVFKKTREKRALPASTCLRHPVDGLLDTNARSSVCPQSGIAGRSMAAHDFIRLEIALKISGDEVPRSHAHAGGVGDGSEGTEGGRPHCRAESLIVVHAVNLSAPLNAESSFE